MTARLSRQEMKRDEVLESVGRAVQTVRRRPRVVATIVALAALAAAAIVVVAQVERRRAAAANRELGEVLHRLEEAAAAAPAGSSAAAGRLGEEEQALLETLVADHPKSGAAHAARLLLASDAATAGDVSRAQALWQEVAATASDTILQAEAELNLIELLRSQGAGAQAVERIRLLLEQGETALPGDLLLAELARTLTGLDRDVEAERAWQRLLDEHPESAFVPEARQALGSAADAMPGLG